MMRDIRSLRLVENWYFNAFIMLMEIQFPIIFSVEEEDF